MFLAKVEMYAYSFGRASSICGDCLGLAISACDRMLESTKDVRSGIGSSGFEDCLRRGTKGAYGFGCEISLVTKEGMSMRTLACSCHTTHAT